VAAYEREIRRAERLAELDYWAALDDDLVAMGNAHLERFPSAQPPRAPQPEPVDEQAIFGEHEGRELEGLSFFRRRDRARARERAQISARAAIADERARRAAEHVERQATFEQAWEQLKANDPETVLEAVEAAFADNQVPAAPIDCEDAALTLLMRFPPVAAIVPERRPDLTPTGRPTAKKRTKTEMNELYAGVLASNVQATVKEAFAVAPGVTEVRILVVSDDVAANGRRLTPLYCGRFQRAGIEGVSDWSDVDPLFFIEQAEGLIAFKGRTRELAPLDLRGEPEVSNVVRQVAESMGWLPPTNLAEPGTVVAGSAVRHPDLPPAEPMTEGEAEVIDDEERASLGVKPLTIKSAKQGQTLVLETEDGPRVAITIGDVIDPAVPRADYDEAPQGRHLVAVRFTIENKGPGVFSNDPAYESKLIGASGGEYGAWQADLVVPTFYGSVRLAVADSRVAYVCYAVDDGDHPRRVEVVFGIDLRADIGQWEITDLSSSATATAKTEPTHSSALSNELSPPTQERERDPRPGYVRGRHYTAYVEEVKTLRRTGQETEAETLLLELLNATEAEARAEGCGVAPWYYEQLAISYRKQNDMASEIAVLERFADQQHAPGATPQQLLERLAKARALTQRG
jgi:hypothetical protein